MGADEYQKNIHAIVKFSRAKPALNEYPGEYPEYPEYPHTQNQMDKEIMSSKNSSGYQDPIIQKESPPFDWFPPILLYNIFEGDLNRAESCLAWINQVYAILSLMYYSIPFRIFSRMWNF